MQKFRVTYMTDGGTVYSRCDFRDDEDPEVETGRWSAPFPNERGNSTAFGLVEGILQSDDCPPALREERIVTVIVSPE